MLRALLLRLVHYLIAVGEYALGFLRYVPQYDFIFAKKHVAAIVEADAKRLRKLPLHVGLIVVEKEFSYKDLANLVVWSVTMGISYVSIYDMNGEIKRNSQQLQKNVEQSRASMIYDKQTSQEIHIYSHSPQYTEIYGVSQGVRKASVHLLSAEDGCQSLVQVAKILSRQVASQQTLVHDISPATVGSILHEMHQFPDPDLCLLFGPTNCLSGYLPWQSRLTEILSLPTHRGLSYNAFVSSLYAYANSEQRFGK